ncbi:MAG TPA: hypothetical protein VGJ44_08305 [Kribbellaceae bacterium]|jgi:hypothetical protein
MIRVKRSSHRESEDDAASRTPAPAGPDEATENLVAVPVGNGVPTPGRLGQLAAAAEVLAGGIDAANQALLGGSELDSGRYWLPLQSAAEGVRRAAEELEKVAGELVRSMATAHEPCEVGWGVCPDHGITLTSTGGQSVCRVLGCHRTPQAPSVRCTEPVAYRVVDAEGEAFLACTGHAVACRRELVGAVITLTADSLEHL